MGRKNGQKDRLEDFAPEHGERERDRLKTRNEDGRRTYRIPRRRERRLPPGEEGSLEEEAAQHRRSQERKERKERCWRGEEVPGKVRQGPRLLRAPAPTARTHARTHTSVKN